VLTASEAEALLRDGVVTPELRPRVEAALAAVREGVRSVHIIDGGVPSALLLEVLTNSGIGTAVRSDAGRTSSTTAAATSRAPATNEEAGERQRAKARGRLQRASQPRARRSGAADRSAGQRARRRASQAIEAADNGSVESAQPARRPQ
jgi:hypothetical protein